MADWVEEHPEPALDFCGDTACTERDGYLLGFVDVVDANIEV